MLEVSKNLASESELESTFSRCPAGEAFALPQPTDYDPEFKRLKGLVNAQRLKGRQIVVVMGVGFVGSVMAGVVADSVDKTSGEAQYFVIGMQQPSTRNLTNCHLRSTVSYYKCNLL